MDPGRGYGEYGIVHMLYVPLFCFLRSESDDVLSSVPESDSVSLQRYLADGGGFAYCCPTPATGFDISAPGGLFNERRFDPRSPSRFATPQCT
jgi:hypothetical protein